MPHYEIWLKEDRVAVVEGDKLEIMGSSSANNFTQGDVVVSKEGRVIAHFKNSAWAGYQELSPREVDRL